MIIKILYEGRATIPPSFHFDYNSQKKDIRFFVQTQHEYGSGVMEILAICATAMHQNYILAKLLKARMAGLRIVKFLIKEITELS